MIRRTLIAVACAIGLAVTLTGFAAADGYARRQVRAGKSAKGRQPQKPRAATAKTSALPTPPVNLIDEAGLKRLLARGTAPQDRPLLVNFWATWCDPCREEFPDLVKIDAD